MKPCCVFQSEKYVCVPFPSLHICYYLHSPLSQLLWKMCLRLLKSKSSFHQAVSPSLITESLCVIQNVTVDVEQPVSVSVAAGLCNKTSMAALTSCFLPISCGPRWGEHRHFHPAKSQITGTFSVRWDRKFDKKKLKRKGMSYGVSSDTRQEGMASLSKKTLLLMYYSYLF